MDSCAGLLVSTRELVKFANRIKEPAIEQRGSLDGCESLLLKHNEFTMALCCNRRKAYDFKLPLK